MGAEVNGMSIKWLLIGDGTRLLEVEGAIDPLLDVTGPPSIFLVLKVFPPPDVKALVPNVVGSPRVLSIPLIVFSTLSSTFEMSFHTLLPHHVSKSL